jgi:sulfite exporter TauE/SafE
VQLQPLWVMGLAATICLGCWMLAYGRVPPLLMALPSGSARQWPLGVSMLSGMAWAALPCGLLYSAIVAAALAPNALQGATVMLAFSLPGGLMLKWLPTYWRRSLHASRHAWVRQWASPQWAIRLSGGTLAMAAGWAISHRLMAQWQAWCA